MAMPAVHRRWTASEVRALVDTNELSTPRYELVDGGPNIGSSISMPA